MGAPRAPTKNCCSSFYGGTCLLCHCGAGAPGVIWLEFVLFCLYNTGMAFGTPLHSTVANMPYCMIIVEVPKGHTEGIHSVVSRNLVSRTLVLIVGSPCDVVGVLYGLRKLQDNEGLTTTLAFAWPAFFWDLSHSSTRWDSLSYGLFPKMRYPRRYCCLLLLPCYLLPATIVTLGATLNPKVFVEPDTYEAECVLRKVNCGKLSGTKQHRPIQLQQ